MTTNQAAATTTDATVDTEWEESNTKAVADQRAEHEKEAASRRARGNVIKMGKPGEYIFRAMPPIKGSGGSPFACLWLHYLKNPEDPQAKGRPVVCKKKQHGLPCKGCDLVSSLYKRNLRDLAKDMASKEQWLIGAVMLACPAEVRDELLEKVEKEGEVLYVPKGPKILQIPMGVYEELSDLHNNAEAGGDFTHPDTGINVIVKRVGTGREDTEYSVNLARKSSPIADRSWLKKLNRLDQAFEQLTDAQMEALISGEAAKEETEFPPKGSDRALPPVEGSSKEIVMFEDPLTGEQVTYEELKKRGRAPAR